MNSNDESRPATADPSKKSLDTMPTNDQYSGLSTCEIEKMLKCDGNEADDESPRPTLPTKRKKKNRKANRDAKKRMLANEPDDSFQEELEEVLADEYTENAEMDWQGFSS